MQRWIWLVPLCAVMLLAACQRDSGKMTAEQAAAEARKMALLRTFILEEQDWRNQRRERLLQTDGWTSLVGLHWIDPGPHYVGSAGDNGIHLSMGPAQMGMIELHKDGGVTFVPGKDAALTLDGQPFAGPATLRPDDDAKGPSLVGFDDGKGVATVIHRGDRYALRVKHADAPTRLHFAGIEYWPAEPSWRIQGKFVPHPAGTTMPVANIIGGLDDAANPGVVEFQRDGKTYRLEAIDEGDGSLFLVFADRTNGHGSYGAGRFVYATKPDAEGHVTVDFNQAYNPPCAFTSFATCPLPPAQNRLDLAITAGEKAYAGAHGS